MSDMRKANRVNDLRRVLSGRGEDPSDQRLEALWKIADPLCAGEGSWQGFLTLLEAEGPKSKPTGVRVRALATLAAKQVKPAYSGRGPAGTVLSNAVNTADPRYGKARLDVLTKVLALQLTPGDVALMLEAIAPLFPAHAKQLEGEAKLYRRFPGDWQEVANAVGARLSSSAAKDGSHVKATGETG